MLKNNCINPVIIGELARCGHGDKVLIADGNFPLERWCKQANRVYLGLCSDLPTVIQVLETLQCEIQIEKVEVMQPEDGGEPEIYQEIREHLHLKDLEKLPRMKFYCACAEQDVRLAISTGESRAFGNVLLTIGVAP